VLDCHHLLPVVGCGLGFGVSSNRSSSALDVMASTCLFSPLLSLLMVASPFAVELVCTPVSRLVYLRDVCPFALLPWLHVSRIPTVASANAVANRCQWFRPSAVLYAATLTRRSNTFIKSLLSGIYRSLINNLPNSSIVALGKSSNSLITCHRG